MSRHLLYPLAYLYQNLARKQEKCMNAWSLAWALAKNAAAFSAITFLNYHLRSLGFLDAWIQHAWGMLLFWVFADALVLSSDLKASQEKCHDLTVSYKYMQELYSKEKNINTKFLINIAKNTASIQKLSQHLQECDNSKSPFFGSNSSSISLAPTVSSGDEEPNPKKTRSFHIVPPLRCTQDSEIKPVKSKSEIFGMRVISNL